MSEPASGGYCPGDTKTIGLMAGGAVRRINLCSFLGRSQLGDLLRAGPCARPFARNARGAAKVIEPVTAEIPRITTEISAAEKDRETVNGDQPKRKRLASHPRFNFFPDNRSMSPAHLLCFAVIHSLPWRILWRLAVHFCASLAGAGAIVTGDLASFKGCD